MARKKRFDMRKEVRKLIELNTNGRVTLVDGSNQEIIPAVKIYAGSRKPALPQYALVKTKDDYVRVLQRLQDVARSNAVALPKFNPW